MLNKLWDKLGLYLQQQIIRYFVMSCFIVLLELGTFAIMNSGFSISYLIATPASMAISFVLNWYFSKAFVFRNSRHAPHVEFGLVLIASLVGVGIQLTVTSICIEGLRLLPIIGKFFAIVVTFFWNYWIRKCYIFGHST